MSQFRELHDVRKKEIAAGKNWKTEEQKSTTPNQREP